MKLNETQLSFVFVAYNNKNNNNNQKENGRKKIIYNIKIVSYGWVFTACGLYAISLTLSIMNYATQTQSQKYFESFQLICCGSTTANCHQPALDVKHYDYCVLREFSMCISVHSLIVDHIHMRGTINNNKRRKAVYIYICHGAQSFIQH